MRAIDKDFQSLLTQVEILKINITVQDGNLHISAPKGVITPELHEQLRAWKESLIQHFQEPEISRDETVQFELIPRNGEQVLPISYSQEGVWFLEKLNPGAATYHIPMGIEFSGVVRSEIMVEAIRWTMNRHESLRTGFEETNNLPTPVIHYDFDVPFTEVDLSHYKPSVRDLEWGRLMRGFLHDPFDLSKAPLFRAMLLKLEPERSHLIFNFHHIIADGWSLGVVIRDLGEAYEAFLSGFMPGAPPLKLQFLEYSAWQKREIFDIAYWENHLKGAPEIINLPTDRPRPLELDASGGILNFRINKEISSGIFQLAKREHLTPFMVLLAAFYILLHRYSRQDDIVVGTPTANRPYEDFEDVVGFFANTIALRSTIDYQISFLEYLKRIRQVALEGFDRQNVPFEMVVNTLQPERSSAWNPIYQVMFALQNNQIGWPESPKLKAKLLNHFAMENSRLDLFFEVWEENDQLVGQVEYNSHLYDVLSVRHMVSHYVTLLNGIVLAPNSKVHELPLMNPDEHKLVVEDWNQTGFPYPEEALVHELFELQVRRTGQKVALFDSTAGVELTWDQVNVRANRLAHYLLDQGVQNQDVVGISCGRSADMIVAILAILKAGSAWLPLDPEYPDARLQYMLEDANPGIVLVDRPQEWLRDHEKTVINIHAIQDKLSDYPDTNIPSTGNALDPLYVLYTSGSTGRAKGVVGHHRGAINRFSWMWNRYPFASGERCAQKTTLNFVDSVWEIFGPLLRGIPLVIVPDQITADATKLVPYLAQQQISRIVLVPSLLRTILDAFPDLAEAIPSLKLWTVSGEELSVSLYKKFSQAFPAAKLLNIYGSSEVAADVTCMDVSSYPTNERMYIGKPIDNMSAFILDDRLEPVPVGVPGEICIAGPGVALGYYNREELTSERFVPNPVTGTGRIFRTGDLGRFNSDGYIEYLGRRDFQIKVRGVRIEPKEVELALESHELIEQAQVGSRPGLDGQPDLVAWVVLNQHDTSASTSLDISAIRAFVSKLVPAYMIPSKIVSLTEFPLTPNGKIDRQNLPEPTQNLASFEKQFSPPRDDVEKVLSSIWCDLLNVQQVGLFDDFFELGGQSMLAVQMFGRVRDQLKVNLNLVQLFEASTLIGLSDLIRTHKDFNQSNAESKPQTTNLLAHLPKENNPAPKLNHLVKINQGTPSVLRTFYCVHGAGGNVLFFKHWQKFLGDIPFYAFQARGVLGVQMPHGSVVEMAAAYVNELLKVDPKGPWILGGYSGGGVVALEMALQLEAQGYEKPPIIMLDTFHPSVQPRNYTMRDRVHLLKTNPVDYVRSVTQKRLMAHFKKDFSMEDLDAMVASGEPLPIELRNDYLADYFAQSLEQYTAPKTYDGEVLLICAEEIWHMFAHAGFKRGWGDTLTALNVVEIPGDHFSIIEEPQVQELIGKLIEGAKRFSATL